MVRRFVGVFCLLFLLLASALAGRRVLRVALYPYVPMQADMWLTVKSEFEAENEDVRLQLVDLTADYYSPDGLANALKAKSVDVMEVDTLFATDLANAGLLEPLPASALPAAVYMPVAERAVQVGGKVYGVPHWMCGNFLFFRKDDGDAARLRKAKGLDAVLQVFGHPMAESQSLLLYLHGKITLGELYLDALLDKYGTPEGALAHVGDFEDQEWVRGQLSKLFLLSPGGMDANARNCDYGSIFQRMFGRRAARGFIGYSEDMHDAVDEAIHGVAAGGPALTNIRFDKKTGAAIGADDIDAIGMPLAGSGTTQMAWVDMLSLRKGLGAQTGADARRFLDFMSSRALARALLIPAPWSFQAPRYLLPARRDMFDDADLLRAAPIYGRLKTIMLGSTNVPRAGLFEELNRVGSEFELAGFLP
ncbi:hypothetical protein BH11ARM2_BH11ARM2_39180 [soil metagenome]